MGWRDSNGECVAPIKESVQQAPLAAFEREEMFLDGEPAAVAGEFSACANDAVAGDHDWQRIAAVGETNRSRGRPLADAHCEFAVGRRLAVRNVEQCAPDALLERRAFGRQRQIELTPSAVEVLRELADDVAEAVIALSPVAFQSVRRTAAILKFDKTEAGVIPCEQQASNGCIEEPVGHS
jgi:hypothetical protein